MKNLFKAITVIFGEVYAELNRELTIDDFTLVEESDVKATDFLNGKLVNKTDIYKLNPSILIEIVGYSKTMFSLNKFTDNADWVKQVNSIDESVFVEHFSCFGIITRREIDFRGCKTNKSREEKVAKAIEEVTSEHTHTTEAVLQSKVDNINRKLHGTIDYYNNLFSVNVSKILTNEDSYVNKFSESEEIKTLEEQYRLTSVALSVCIEQRNKVVEKLAGIKREVALNLLKNDEWKIEDENNSSVIIPEPVVENVKTAIENAFVKKNPLFQ